MQGVRYSIAVATMTIAVNTMAAEKGWVKLRGNALTQAFANQNFGDGVHFAYQFLPAGQLHGMNMCRQVHGRWWVVGNQLCWRRATSKPPEECYEVRQQGQAVRLFLDGQEVQSGDLTPLRPNPTEVTR